MDSCSPIRSRTSFAGMTDDKINVDGLLGVGEFVLLWAGRLIWGLILRIFCCYF